MILNGDEIVEYHKQGRIDIDPWDENRIGCNSYDVALGPKLLYYEVGDSFVTPALDPRKKNPTKELVIPEDGHLLRPGEFVLGNTAELCTNKAGNLVPMIEGRSSIARLGINIHVTAGFGDVGFCGRWTLEIFCLVPVILYSGMPIGQLYWIKTDPTARRYKGKYQNHDKPTESRMHEEYK